jgi:hypothetical protein
MVTKNLSKHRNDPNSESKYTSLFGPFHVLDLIHLTSSCDHVSTRARILSLMTRIIKPWELPQWIKFTSLCRDPQCTITFLNLINLDFLQEPLLHFGFRYLSHLDILPCSSLLKYLHLSSARLVISKSCTMILT